MRFNPDKREVLRVTNRRSRLPASYSIHGQVLNIVEFPKQLGVTLQKYFSWDTLVNNITKKANSTLIFLGRNISQCPKTIKAKCYSTLMRPTLEYAASIQSPTSKHKITKLAAVQRRAARFATGDYHRTSTATSMLQQLLWQTFKQRRDTTRVVMLYMIVYHLVDIPADQHIQRSSFRTRGHTMRFLIPNTMTAVYHSLFFLQAIRLWNQLPWDIVEAKTLDSFKIQLSSFVPRLYKHLREKE